LKKLSRKDKHKICDYVRKKKNGLDKYQREYIINRFLYLCLLVLVLPAVIAIILTSVDNVYVKAIVVSIFTLILLIGIPIVLTYCVYYTSSLRKHDIFLWIFEKNVTFKIQDDAVNIIDGKHEIIGEIYLNDLIKQ
jgi:hypothetical protein